MCFYNDDYYWTASVQDETSESSGKTCRCDECGCDIAADQWRHQIHQQEHEACQVCGDEWSDDYIDKAAMEEELTGDDKEWAAENLRILAEHKCDYGETCDYVRCEACHLMLIAVEQREKDEGCPADARRPALTELWDNMHEMRGDGYVGYAVAMFPMLSNHPRVAELIEE